MSDGPGSGDDLRSGEAGAPGSARATGGSGSGRRGGPDRSDRRGGSDGPGWRRHAYDVVTSAGAVLAVGLLLFAVSGVWPPLVAIESPSMEPHIDTGDLVFVMEEERFPGEGAHGDTGVVTAARGADTGYRSFQGPGDVIVFEPGGNAETTPIIHRAMFWVEDNESWYDRANQAYLGGASSCQQLAHCPAPHAGFITKGDNNDVYDQIDGADGNQPVRPAWVLGTAEYRVPYLGWLRLEVRGAAASGVTAPETGGSPSVAGSAGVGNATASALG